ncbi:hypothetical protein [Roseitranquillus sediminis]|uniref:hypothetical protein n=1 Tax=Roseitranquillus sediminis TaxID=2809051 RepID=UPI001D0CD366|nr:hypothetical protein [Roseitranquillus sediminis]MBM9595936.1 hypothetical protein [Roseitranquillus sediminis]
MFEIFLPVEPNAPSFSAGRVPSRNGIESLKRCPAPVKSTRATNGTSAVLTEMECFRHQASPRPTLNNPTRPEPDRRFETETPTMYETPTGGILLPQPPSAARSIKMGVQKHFTGALVCGEDEGRAMEMESHTEMQIALIMLARREVVEVENQVPFPWKDEEGALRTHFFDLRVSLRDGTRVAIFAKNSRDAQCRKFTNEKRQIVPQVTADFADRVCLMSVIIERTCLVLVDAPNVYVRPDQVPGDIVTLRQPVQGLAGQALLRDLPLELDAVGSVLCHGFRPSKARRTRSILSAPTVRPQGPTPIGGSDWEPIDDRARSFGGRLSVSSARPRAPPAAGPAFHERLLLSIAGGTSAAAA